MVLQKRVLNLLSTLLSKFKQKKYIKQTSIAFDVRLLIAMLHVLSLTITTHHGKYYGNACVEIQHEIL
jgi:hypothetical protein